MIFRPEPGVPRLDDPRYSRYLQFDAIPESGRDSSFVKLFSIRVRGDERCCFALKEDSNRWKDLKFRSNVNESRNDDKGGHLKISKFKNRNRRLWIIAMKLCKKFHFHLGHSRGRGACFDLRAAECLHREAGARFSPTKSI